MKKLLFLLFVAGAFMACEGPEGADGAPGRDGQNGQQGIPGKDGQDGEGVKWSNLICEIKASDWKLYGQPEELNSYFYAEVKVPEITDFVYDVGTVISYIELEPDLKNGLPYVVHMGETGSNGKEFLYTRTFDFDFSPGYVTFYCTYSDFMGETPGNEKFHLVLMW